MNLSKLKERALRLADNAWISASEKRRFVQSIHQLVRYGNVVRLKEKIRLLRGLI